MKLVKEQVLKQVHVCVGDQIWILVRRPARRKHRYNVWFRVYNEVQLKVEQQLGLQIRQSIIHYSDINKA